MTNPLRAFLLLKSEDTDWKISVFRSLEEVLKAWEDRSDPLATAVLHCGFSRRVASTFTSLVTNYPGRVLLTPGGRFALPSMFKASKMPVGEIEDEPIYLALEGWGYSEDEPNTGNFSEPIEAPSAERWKDWLLAYTIDFPSDVEVLIQSGVTSERTYVTEEPSLPIDVRERLARFRSEILCRHSNDPCELARSFPPWLLSASLEDLGLTVRLSNVFRRERIATVSDLAEHTLEQLYRMKNFGRRSVGDLTETLNRALEKGLQTPEVLEAENSHLPLLSLVERTLVRLPERDADIVRRRMGLGCQSQTLEEIGGVYGITRERVRQLEARTAKQIIEEEYWDDLLNERITQLIAKKDSPLPLAGVEAVDDWFEGFAANKEAIGYLLSNMCESRIFLLRIDGLDYITFLSGDEWVQTKKAARDLLAGAIDYGWSRGHCRDLVAGLLPESAREFRHFLWEEVSRFCHFTGDNDEATLVSFGRGANALVAAILEDAEKPLHYTEIAKRSAERTGNEVDERRVHNAAGEVGYLLGRGTFGTDRHLGLDPDQLVDLATEATEIVLDGPTGRQWHASEIASIIAENPEWEDLAPNKYVISVALEIHGSLKGLGRLVWCAPGSESSGARVDVNQAVLAIMKQAGGPLKGQEIMQRLAAIRGINSATNLVFSHPIIRLGGRLWGLNDRDVPVKAADQIELQQRVIRELVSHGRGLHISEIPADVLQNMHPRTFLSLASLNERIRVSPGQYLYLDDWGQNRRLTISDACHQTLKTNGPLTFDEIFSAVSELIGREVSRNSLSSVLQSSDAELRTDERWVLNGDGRGLEDLEQDKIF